MFPQEIQSTLGDIDWSPGRARELAKKAIESLGEPAKWTAENLKELKNIAGGLLPSELKQMVDKAVKDGLKGFKNVKLEIDQVSVMSIIAQLQVRDDMLSVFFIDFQAQEIVIKVKNELKVMSYSNLW